MSFIHKNKDTFVEGSRVERERIIALPFIHEAFGGKHNEDCITCHNITLIKGENE